MLTKGDHLLSLDHVFANRVRQRLFRILLWIELPLVLPIEHL